LTAGAPEIQFWEADLLTKGMIILGKGGQRYRLLEDAVKWLEKPQREAVEVITLDPDTRRIRTDWLGFRQLVRVIVPRWLE